MSPLSDPITWVAILSTGGLVPWVSIWYNRGQTTNHRKPAMSRPAIPFLPASGVRPAPSAFLVMQAHHEAKRAEAAAKEAARAPLVGGPERGIGEGI